MMIAIGCGGGATDPDAGPRDAGRGDAGPGDAGGQDAGPAPYAPDSYCPGAPGCATGSGGQLQVGAAAVEITPAIDAMTDVLETDVDGDGNYEFSQGDRYAERNGVPGFQGVWMAGFNNAHGATGVHDPQWVRAIALRNGETTIVIAALDVIGWFIDEMDQVREMVSDVGADFVSFTSTHCHECRDVVGLWGMDEASSGVDPAYNAYVRERAAQAIRMAVGALRPANVQYASFDLRDLPGGSLRYISDARDPHIVDDQIRLMRFLEDGTDTTIATLVNFGSHAEYLDDRNTLLSSDFPHWLRDGIENGTDGPDGARDGVGGVAVFYQGAVGSQIGPIGARVSGWDGTPLDRATDPLTFTAAMGSQLAYH
ncbi:MAG: hypothetical protein IT378_10275, partial [Sandaracinaceae bacterium]|nr:hypothetical protein [Sandaracinaceae bacterium]